MRLYASSLFPAILSAASMSSKRARYSARFESWRSFRKLSRPLLRSLTLRLDSPSYSPSAMSAATTFIETINTEYEKVHKSFELQFWGTKMALGGEAYSVPELTRTKAEMEVVRLGAHPPQQQQHDKAHETRGRILEAFSKHSVRNALSVHYAARYGSMGGICMHARPDREVGSPAGSPYSHLLNTTTPAVSLSSEPLVHFSSARSTRPKGQRAL